MNAADRPADELVVQLYDELRVVAHARLRDERTGHTLGTTALVNEVYLRLTDQVGLRGADRVTFLAAASRTMRRLLVDHARHRNRRKRGGGEVAVSLDEVAPLLSDEQSEELEVLDDALQRLALVSPRGSAVVQHRFFGGLTLDETAVALGVSAKTVQREWTVALAWLRKEVARDLELFRSPA